MSTASNQFVESALALPQSERAELALQLLRSLDPPGELLSQEEFGQHLRDRVGKYRCGEIESSSLDEARALINNRRSEGTSH